MINYCSKPERLTNNIICLKRLVHVLTELGQLVKEVGHATAIDHLGNAYTSACRAKNDLQGTIEFYHGPESDGNWPAP